MKEIVSIATEVLRVHPRNQEFFDDITGDTYEQFKSSIKNEGVITPLIIAPDMTVISGHQRLKACKDLEICKVPVIINDDLNTDEEKLKILLATNFGREKNDTAKQRKVAVEYVNLCGFKWGDVKTQKNTSYDNHNSQLTQERIAQNLGISVPTLNEMLAIERKLTPEIKELLDNGIFNRTTATKVLTKLSQQEQEELLTSLPITEKLTQKQVQEYVNRLQEKDNQIAGYKMKLSKITTLENEIETNNTEITRLKCKISELVQQGTKTEYIEKEVENPENIKRIKELQSKVEELTRNNADISNRLIESSKKVSAVLGNNTNFNLVSSCSEITLQMLNFVKDMAKYDYMAESFNEIPIATKQEYKRCVQCVEKWANRILTTIDQEEEIIEI